LFQNGGKELGSFHECLGPTSGLRAASDNNTVKLTHPNHGLQLYLIMHIFFSIFISRTKYWVHTVPV